MTPEELTRFTALEARLASLETRCARLELGERYDILEGVTGILSKRIVTACLLASCDYFGVTKTEILGRSRIYHVVWARQVFQAMVYEFGNRVFTDTGKALRKDHSSIMHSVKTVSNECENNQKRAEQVLSLRAKIAQMLGKEKTQ